MSKAQTKISDKELLKKLQESYLDFDQQQSIEPFIPEMNDAERKELLKLIDKANDVQNMRLDQKKEYVKGLKKIHAEYEKKADQLAKDESEYARQEFEKLETKQDKEEMEELESEMKNI